MTTQGLDLDALERCLNSGMELSIGEGRALVTRLREAERERDEARYACEITGNERDELRERLLYDVSDLRIASLTKERDEAVSAAREASRMFEGAANAADKAEARIAELEAAHAEAVLVWQPRAEQAEKERDEARADALRFATERDNQAMLCVAAEARVAELEADRDEMYRDGLVVARERDALHTRLAVLERIADAAEAYVTALDRTRELGRMTQDERGERCREYDEAERVFRAALAARGKDGAR